MKISLYNQNGEEVKTTTLPKEVFEVEINPDLIHQVIVSQMANRRRVIAHSKDRGEVRGGGKKPWRQKGTGRARHGSIRSPLWKGGGITFGPRKEKVFKREIPKKMKRKALLMVLSAKAKNSLLILFEDLKLEKPKTKDFAKMIETWKSKIKNFKGDSILIVLPKIDKNFILAARNLPKIETIQAKDLNALDLLSYKYLVLAKDSIKIIKETFLGK